MMRQVDNGQGKLFFYSVDLCKRARAGHPLRNILKAIDFDFVYDDIVGSYSTNGNVSVQNIQELIEHSSAGEETVYIMEARES